MQKQACGQLIDVRHVWHNERNWWRRIKIHCRQKVEVDQFLRVSGKINPVLVGHWGPVFLSGHEEAVCVAFIALLKARVRNMQIYQLVAELKASCSVVVCSCILHVFLQTSKRIVRPQMSSHTLAVFMVAGAACPERWWVAFVRLMVHKASVCP